VKIARKFARLSQSQGNKNMKVTLLLLLFLRLFVHGKRYQIRI